MVLLFTIRGKKTKTDSEKDKENAQMHALLGTICQIKKKLP